MTRRSEMPNVKKKITENKNKRRRKKVFSVMAVLVALTTAGILMKPAIALQEETYCGLEEHKHTMKCYELISEAETESVLEEDITQNDAAQNNDSEEYSDTEEAAVVTEQIKHEHTDECYTYVDNEEEQVQEPHEHTDECYVVEEIVVCGEEERGAHSHDDSCYETIRELTCDNEAEDHEHTDDCYSEEKVLACDREETSGHTHEDDCYAQRYTLNCNNGESDSNESGLQKVLICGLTEDDYDVIESEASKEAESEAESETKSEPETEYKANVNEIESQIEIDTDAEMDEELLLSGLYRLVCEKEVHTHTLQCYSNPDADVETDKDWEATLPYADEYTGDVRLDTIAVAQSQLGYSESTMNYLVVNDDEKKGYTRYGQWYGDIYGDWNAMFASFCIYYGGATDIPIDEYYDSWIESLSDPEIDLYRLADDEYIPQEGDLVFLDLDGDDEVDWVGVIEKINDDGNGNITSIETIEGDLEDRVDRASYEIGDNSIIGYCELDSNADDDDSLKKSKENFKFTATTDSGITVTVSGKSEVLPYPADEIIMTVEDIEDDTIDELVGIELEKEGLAASKNYQVDISLWHVIGADTNEEDGDEESDEDEDDIEVGINIDEINLDEVELEEIQPTGPVKVTFSGIDIDEDHQLKIYHIEDENTNAKDMEIEMDDDGDAIVDTEHFSTFVIGLVGYDVKDDHLLSGEIDFDEMEGNYQLVGDAWTDEEIDIIEDTVLDLNGYTLYYMDRRTLFTVSKDKSFTLIDTRANSASCEVIDGTKYGNESSIEWEECTIENENHNKISNLTYYVTESTVQNDIYTNETLYKYTLQPTGMIVGESGRGIESLIEVEGTGTFNLYSGCLAILNGEERESHVINSSGTTNIYGGYICGGGGYSKSYGGGGGIYSSGTMTMTGGVIAANTGTKGGGVYIADGATFNMSGGVISGNTASVRAYQAGGGGIYNDNGTLTISGGYITNNSYSGEYIDEVPEYSGSTLVTAGDRGQGTHGGGGIASCKGTVTMTGGYVTGNWSNEAGGGMYIGYNDNGAKLYMRGGIVASNCCQNSEGGGIRISGGTEGLLEATDERIVHITNNITETTNDWGGGGIFIQANGLLTVYNSLITNNSAQGFGGGVAGCPTGTILVVKTKGTAIYSNSAEGVKYSGGTGGKADDMNTVGMNEDYDGQYIDTEFLTRDDDGNGCYQDYYCVHETGTSAITMALGEMLGGESAKWTGRCDGEAVSIPKTGYQVANWLCGLTAHPEQAAIDKALDIANVYITGNTSSIHGGGIMSNGNLVLGDANQYDSVCPPLVIKGSKGLDEDTTLDLNTVDMSQFEFLLLTEKPVLTDGKWVYNEDAIIGSATASNSGSFVLTTDKNYDEAGNYTYYLIEKTGSDINIIYDTRMYTINVVIVKDEIRVLGVYYTAYRVQDVTVNGESAMDDVVAANVESDDADEGYEIQLLSLDDEMETADEPAQTSTSSKSSYTITYDNSESNWSKVYIYTWDDNDTKYSGEWPGTEMKDADGDGVYTYTLYNKGEKYVIFSSGTYIDDNGEEKNYQTGDLLIDDLVSDDSRDKAQPYIIYYDNTASGWDEVYIYTWSNKGTFSGDWPGTKMYKSATDENLYYYELPNRGELYVIFSDGEGKTADKQTSDLYIEDILENNNTYVSYSAKGVDSYTLVLGQAFVNKVMAPVNLKLTKMDSRYENEAFKDYKLSDAMFDLYEINGNEYLYTGGGTSDEDGVVAFRDSNNNVVQLKRGTKYFLKEVTPPNGYEIAGPWIIEVGSESDVTAQIYNADVTFDDDNNLISCTVSSGDLGTSLTKEGNNLITLMTIIPDIATAYQLPHTGGHGTLPYVIGGALLITGAGLLLWHRANKRRKEDIAST